MSADLTALSGVSMNIVLYKTPNAAISFFFLILSLNDINAPLRTDRGIAARCIYRRIHASWVCSHHVDNGSLSGVQATLFF